MLGSYSTWRRRHLTANPGHLTVWPARQHAFSPATGAGTRTGGSDHDVGQVAAEHPLQLPVVPQIGVKTSIAAAG